MPIGERWIEIWTADLPASAYPLFHDVRAQRDWIVARFQAAGLPLRDVPAPIWP